MSQSHDEMIAVIQAHKDGKKIECRSKIRTFDSWDAACDPVWNFHDFNYRIAPTPVPRPWKPEEVPIIGVLYRQHKNKERWSTVKETYVSDERRYVILSFHSGGFHTAELWRDLEHSLDNGHTWLPCGVMEEQ